MLFDGKTERIEDFYGQRGDKQVLRGTLLGKTIRIHLAREDEKNTTKKPVGTRIQV